MHDRFTYNLLKEQEEQSYLLKRLVQQGDVQLELLRSILHYIKSSTVTGGSIHQIGEHHMALVPISPGNSPKFQVTPTFSGAPFTLDGAKAQVTSSDTTNFPVALDPSDPEGRTIVAAIPETAQPVGGSEDVTITWTYTNDDGVVATVTGSVTELGIVDDVTGGTFAQVA